MAIECKVVTGNLPTSGTTVDLTSSGFGNPTAAIIVVSRCASGNNPKTSIYYSVGFVEYHATSPPQTVNSISSADNQSTSLTARSQNNARCYERVNVSTTNVDRYGTASFITDGVRITLDAAETVASYIECILIKGTSNVKVEEKQLTVNGANDITTTGFKPDLVFFTSIGHATVDSGAGHAIFSFGAAHNDSTDTVSQGLVAFNSETGVGTSDTYSVTRDDAAVGQCHNGSQTWGGSIGTFDANGFTVTTSATPGNDYIQYLALESDDPDDFYVGVITTKTTTGTQAYTGTGFEPVALILGQTHTTTTNTIQTGNGGGIGMASSTTAEYSAGMADEDGQGLTDCQSDFRTDGVAQCYSHTGTLELAAELSSFDSNGFTLNFDTVSGGPGSTARKWLAIAIGDAAAGAGTTVSPTTGSIAFDGAQPTIFPHKSTAPTVGTAAFEGVAPTLSLFTTATVQPTVGTAAFEGLAPAISAVTGKSVAPTTGTIAFDGQAPTTFRAVVQTPTVGEAAFEGQTPTVALPGVNAPGAGSAAFEGLAPTVFVGVHQYPTTGAIAFEGIAPDFAGELVGTTVSPTTGAMGARGFSPDLALVAPVGEWTNISRNTSTWTEHTRATDSWTDL